MRVFLKAVGKVLLAVTAAAWLFLAFRLYSAALFLIAVVATVERMRSPTALVIAAWLAFFGSTWLPFDVTLRSAPDGPKFVQCCPYPFENAELTRKRVQGGECKLCNDLVSGFEPRWFLVW